MWVPTWFPLIVALFAHTSNLLCKISLSLRFHSFVPRFLAPSAEKQRNCIPVWTDTISSYAFGTQEWEEETMQTHHKYEYKPQENYFFMQCTETTTSVQVKLEDECQTFSRDKTERAHRFPSHVADAQTLPHKFASNRFSQAEKKLLFKGQLHETLQRGYSASSRSR